MSKIVLPLCCFCVIVLSSFQAQAMTAAQKALIHESFVKLGMICIEEHPITEEDVSNLTAKKIAAGPNVPCFLACIFKAQGIMDDKGMLEKETVLERAKKVFDNAEELKLLGDYLHSCSHINEEAVSDGEDGCERASLAYKCLTENALQYGIDL